MGDGHISSLVELAAELPAPEDDGQASHLTGMTVPSVELHRSDGKIVDVSEWASDRLVAYLFPAMGPPDRPDPDGWMQIPGAYGCTEQTCTFRDLHGRFRELGYRVAGISAQPLSDQRDTASRLDLSFPLLADPDRKLGEALGLPTLTADERTFYKRLTFIAQAGQIAKVFYPVFPPWENPDQALGWIRAHDDTA